MNPFPEPLGDDAPPPYEYSSTSNDAGPASSSHSYSPSPPLSPLENRASIGSSLFFEPPPEFSAFPITFSIRPNSTLITPSIGTQASYELTHPLDGRSCNVYLAEITPNAALNNDGHLLDIDKQQHLYKIYAAAQIPLDPDATAISAQRRGLIPGTVLQRKAKGYIWEATSHGEKWIAKGKIIYSARRRKNGDLPWKDANDRLVAVEHVAEQRAEQSSENPVAATVDSETLEVLVPLNKNMLDFLVAVWVARVFQEAKKERIRCEEAEKKRMRDERRTREREQERERARDKERQGGLLGDGELFFSGTTTRAWAWITKLINPVDSEGETSV